MKIRYALLMLATLVPLTCGGNASEEEAVSSISAAQSGRDYVVINNDGVVAGTFSVPGPNNDRAFRFDPPGPAAILDPLPTEPESWGQAINACGEVLGYSFVSAGLERIGIWHHGTFRTAFVEGTPEFPTVSNRLLWNDQGLIVITNSTDMKSYIVPRPNVRLDMAELTTCSLPPWTSMADVNNEGDLIGIGGSSFGFFDHSFLLERDHE